MRAGKLNRLISIRSPSATARSTDGEPIVTWSTVLGNVWADVQPLSGRELFRASERYSEVTTRFIVRYSSLVDATMRVIDLGASSAAYDIKAVIDINDERKGLEILAQRIE